MSFGSYMDADFGIGSRLTRLLVISSFFIALVSPAMAQDTTGPIILSFEGEVEIHRPSAAPTVLKISTTKTDTSIPSRDRLSPGDTIVTGRNGRLVLGMSDGSQAVIAPKTTVRLDDLTGSPRQLFNIIRGKTRIQIEKPGGRPNPYRVNTPTTVIAVRGTIFDVIVNDDQTEVFLHEGEVAVSNRSLPDQALRLLAGQSTKVFRFRPPIAPRLFSSGKNDGIFRLRMPALRQKRSGIDDGRLARRGHPGGPEPRIGQRDQSGSPRRHSGADNIPATSSRPGPGGRRF